jgi:ribonuclease VapC
MKSSALGRTESKVVLDSSAIVAIFKEEEGFQILKQKINEAASIEIGAPTMVETVNVLASLTGQDQRAFVEAYLKRIGAKIVAFDETHYLIASEAFLQYGRGFNSKAKLNFGDCFSYAVAKASQQPLLFVGNDFLHTDIPAA